MDLHSIILIFFCLDKYSNYDVHDHIKENKEVWYPHFYENQPFDGKVWRDQILSGKKLNKHHNFDFSFLKQELSMQEAIDHFCNVEIYSPLKKLLPNFKILEKLINTNVMVITLFMVDLLAIIILKMF